MRNRALTGNDVFGNGRPSIANTTAQSFNVSGRNATKPAASTVVDASRARRRRRRTGDGPEWSRYACDWSMVRRRDLIIRVEAGIGPLQLHDAAKQQASCDQQDYGDGQL